MNFGKTAGQNVVDTKNKRQYNNGMAAILLHTLTNEVFRMSDKSFKIAGVSKLKGSYKVRFANDMTRVKVLAKTGHSEIELMELPRAMTKPELVTFLKGSELYKRPEFAQAIDAADAKYNGEKTVKVAGVKVKAPAKSKATTKTPVTA